MTLPKKIMVMLVLPIFTLSSVAFIKSSYAAILSHSPLSIDPSSSAQIKNKQTFILTAGKGEIDGKEAQKIQSGAENFIKEMGDRAIGFLSNASMSQSQKQSEFRKLLRDSFDLQTIGRYSLGRYWRVANDTQKKEYQDLFEDLIVNVYAQRFNDYKGQDLSVRSSRPEGESDVLVNSFIVDKSGTEFTVDWRVRYKNGRYRIIDVIIEGVSMSLTQRSDFSSVIQRGGGDVSVLISHLKNGQKN